ncbi:hypothetical protein NE237_031791 [Protea cynaroides]|uniref:Protein phosphatase n=1 Tax=Protea cynaroides TaxID=273540 RepID=A0A9Q0R2S9_9MAGN|nr:hypothetical protein NE237_031791 [Protea cynaroides]
MSETERPAKLPRVFGFHSVADVTSISSHNRDENSTSASTTKKLKLIMGCSYLPKENGSNPKGEDSHFICEKEQVFGIADGVGGWAKKGIDAGIYARELMFNSAMAVQSDGLKGSVDPLTVLKEAYSNTKALGSSTACIVALKDDNCLHFANVGDSGFLLIRGDRVIYKSQPQQRGFNCPFQLGNNVKSDRPSSAFEFRVEIMDGDIIVAGTDGLFDNLYEDNIMVAMKKVTDRVGMYPYWVARMIAEDARIISKDKDIPSPFSLASKKAGYTHSGGKIDDITVLVAHVISSPTNFT